MQWSVASRKETGQDYTLKQDDQATELIQFDPSGCASATSHEAVVLGEIIRDEVPVWPAEWWGYNCAARTYER